ncbi:MAG: hypothetical protein ACP5LH_03575, partial [Candidatus Micrarchaeia archaeon]
NPFSSQSYATTYAKESASDLAKVTSNNQFNLNEAESIGYIVQKSSTTPGGYILYAPSSTQAYDIFGNPLPTSIAPSAKSAQSYINAWNEGATTIQQTPPVDYHTFGENAKVTWDNPHSPNFTVTEKLPDGTTYQYSGSITIGKGMSLGTIEAQDAAIDQAWQNLLKTSTTINQTPANSLIKVAPSSEGETISINTAPSTSAPETTYTIAPGFTETIPSSQASTVAAMSILAKNPINTINSNQTYTSNGISFSGAQLQNYYNQTSSNILSSLLSSNPTVTINQTTAPFSEFSTAQQQSYANSLTNQLIQSNTYQGAGYYDVDGNAIYISNPNFYSTSVSNDLLKSTSTPLYAGQSQLQAEIEAKYPQGVSTPTFFSDNGNATIILPQNWQINPTNGNLTINGKSPTPQQSIEYAEAFQQFIYANPPSTSSSTSTSNFIPQTNWYSMLLTSPQGGAIAGNLASLKYVPTSILQSSTPT